MTPNPLLKKLGLSDNDRAVIFHADDIGMCHASLAAYQELIDYGLLSSAATMAPCPWFLPTAVYCRQNQEAKSTIDMGVHLTLTSEWEQYRWGPISTQDPVTGLLDDEGYLYHTSEMAQQHGQPAAMLAEMEAQIKRALAMGIDVTHIDTHMGTVFHPALLPGYFQLALKYQLPAMALRRETAVPDEHEIDAETAAAYLQLMDWVEAQGLPLLDKITGMRIEQGRTHLETAQRLLEELPIGVSYFIAHPSIDTPELRAITNDWPTRIRDYQLFISDEWRQVVEASGVKVIGWRAVRSVMRGSK